MIVCFSGTGNTLFCAHKLSDILGDEIMSLSRHMPDAPQDIHIRLNETDRRIIWMFPVYSWGIPPAIHEIMKKATIESAADTVHWMVATCGDDSGLTAGCWRKTMRKRGFMTAAAFCIQMPNTYTFMKGFDVDSTETESDKIVNSESRISMIARHIADNAKVPDNSIPGRYAWIKTAIVRPLFNRFLTSPKPFRATDSCTGCGLCASSCPMGNISMCKDRRPLWNNRCMMCSRCYHICPAHAVQYGRKTIGKGQYRRLTGLIRQS